MNRIIAATFLLLATLFTAPINAYGKECSVEPPPGMDPRAYWAACHDEIPHRGTNPRITPGEDPSSPGSNATFAYVWVPTCPGALPSDPDVGSLDCRAAHSCNNPQLISMSLYSMQLTNAAGERVQRGWHYLGSECRNPQDAGPTEQRRELTWTDVLSGIRQVGVPGGTVEAPNYTLVNLDTTFYTEPTAVDRNLVIIGYDVEVRLRPSTYTWNWGDGTSETTSTPGHPYPSTDVTHTYVHATPPNQSLLLSVDVTYTARYRVDGGEWQPIPQTLTIPGTPTGLPIKQASAVLVADD